MPRCGVMFAYVQKAVAQAVIGIKHGSAVRCRCFRPMPHFDFQIDANPLGFGACSFAQICDLATEEILFIEQASVAKQFGAGQEHGPGYIIDRAQRIVS